MKESFLIILFVFAAALFISCGSNGSLFGVNNASQFKSGSCGLDVMGDYNSVAFACIGLVTETKKTKCASHIERFLEKYPGINCEATIGFGLDKTTIRVNEERLNSLRLK